MRRFAPASLSLRLVALFGLLAMVILAALGTYLSHSLHVQLERRDDEELAGKCRSINHLVEHAASLEDILARRHLVLDTLTGHDQLLVRIARADGSTLLESHDPTRTPPGIDLSQVDIRAWDSIQSWKLGDLRARYVASKPVTRSGEQAVVLVVRTASDRMLLLAEYRSDVWWAAGVGALLAILMSYFLVRSGLRPLRTMAAQTRAVSANRLDTRLDLQAAPRELHEIVESFNEMLDRLHRSFQQLSQFSADLAHDVRTPLNNLMVQTQVALGKPRGIDEYQALLSSNIEEYERLSRMMESMLFLARAENAHVVLQWQELDVAQELTRIADYFEGIADEAQVRLVVQGAGRLQADATLLRRAVGNLVANAIRYTPADGVIRLQVDAAGDGMEISVSNPGAGIPAEQLERLFDRFYRADPSRSSAGGSSGLGLAIVRSIMMLHGGQASVTSSPGQLTVFSLRFPGRSAV
ncbi:heavy metal sensor histidine kinase [Herbaspirillum seropedicae]|uniref:Sensor protein n=1 Tax=Herbaspirillum seropedicae (strain SmR1) TaxID=757424 RepID=D8ITQ5_HERSS|nr:heavy metal sensor histidine kinase [Herbaspirillum seropedicae]ADJ61546.1 transmembrane sensory transduction histidine kinase for cobalt/zinc/ cadmium resistance transcription regulator protein [Herbaspirillum seropedicae SmR1]AKN63770.1 histidine kinase [Herbaspirillum seropedicae]AON52345.1 sensory transduction histidine kinase for cobalt/zinc/ cadmium resistance transcription regulator protein [Herbaspirillum seropedicae]MDR6398327.1 two-component system heavy metal sensor histidine kina